ncbi:Formate--tetrahydrofolate ligase [Acholeplasma hippikon]|uniref:Formate--tetrahydrofolate ligase n=2 Tax=Acholeplasma hippikon TaxID=264636 RepID=A0A449BKM2_9MOLU|nr:Formate--tetrahydrofolate ligase [Acholeplasma hippikon]
MYNDIKDKEGEKMNKYRYLVENLGINEDEIISYGNDKFKISPKILNRIENKPNGNLILVSAINPTSSGEGKTTVSIGLAQGLKKIGKSVMLALREPSLGPVFGLKGGATGGGVSSLEPALDIDLHFTGDLHALTSANNLLSAVIDNHIHFGNELKIKEVYWQRAMDMNDRSLRSIETEIRTDKFQITAASEMMAILALARDFKDLRERVSNIVIGINEEEKLIHAKDLGCVDAILLLLKDAIKPNIVFAKEMVPAFVHAGPFANIAHGCSSVIATNTALKLADYVVTEAGFGADLGMEKFLHIKQPHLYAGAKIVVVVATIKALKLHGGANEDNLLSVNFDALEKGLSNLEKHLENIKTFNLKSVVAINKFHTDTLEEIEFLRNWAVKHNYKVELSEAYSLGGLGAENLAKLVISEIEQATTFKPLYNLEEKHQDKIERIAKTLYGAKEVIFTKKALDKLNAVKDFNYPVCIAKTPLSLSGDPKLKGCPKDFTLDISDVKISFGAKLIVTLTKGINTMPGLNEHPRALDIRVDDEGELIIWY